MVQQKDELCRKRVLYIGSAVPMETADGLEGVQKPLLERYPVDDDQNVEGILSFLSIVPGGLTLQYDSDPNRILFFPISSLTLCAAVRCVSTTNTSTGEKTARFVSLSSPVAGGSNAKRPAIFTTITRRTEGRKVLECHGFVCSCAKDALDLVQYTGHADRVSKGKVNGAMPPAGGGFSLDGHTSTPRGFETNTFRNSSFSAGASAMPAVAGPDGEHPVRLVAGDAVSQRVAPEFYDPVPAHGYFYKTPDTQIKTYTVERVTNGESELLRAVSPNAAAAATLPRMMPAERRVPMGPPTQGAAMTLPYPQGRTLIPVRAMQAPSQPVIRPRFFSPPPPVLRPRPMGMPPNHMIPRDPYVFLPPPPNIIDAPYAMRRHPRRRSGSDSSSRDSSASSSPASPRDMNGRRAVNGDGADGSSDVSSRPRSPPTDYERRPRVSRKEQFDRSRYLNAAPVGYSTLPGGPMQPPGPYEFYLYPPRYPYMTGPPGYPPYMMERARSVPPPLARGKSKERKKSRKSKKDKKKSGKRVYGVPSDISTDSVGYTSEIGPTADGHPRMPRDFRRFENQFKHERAFSKSLREQFRDDGGAPESAGNAYSLNDHMAQRGGHTDEFNLY